MSPRPCAPAVQLHTARTCSRSYDLCGPLRISAFSAIKNYLKRRERGDTQRAAEFSLSPAAWAELQYPTLRKSPGLPRIDALSFPARKRIGRYEICSQLGAGGMGEVYLANDTKLDRKVALKVLPSDVVDEQSDERVRRFIQEAKAAA